MADGKIQKNVSGGKLQDKSKTENTKKDESFTNKQDQSNANECDEDPSMLEETSEFPADDEYENDEQEEDANMDADKKDESKDGERIEQRKVDYDKLSFDELMKLKIKLQGGEENFLFSRGPKFSEDCWPINCHLCRNGNIMTEEKLRQHLVGRPHMNRLKRKLPLPEKYSEPFYQWLKEPSVDKAIMIYPGETLGEVTDELKDRIVEKESFQVKAPDEKTLKELENEPIHEYNKKFPLLGLCYIYKMKENTRVVYVCVLCNKRIQGEAFRHIVGTSHQLSYVERHFRTLRKKVADSLRKEKGQELKYHLRNVFRKLYRKIENIRGHRHITIVDSEDYNKNSKKYRLSALRAEHYDEKTIMITDQEVDALIRKCLNSYEFIKPDLVSLDSPARGRKSPPPRRQGRVSRRDYEDRNWIRYEMILQDDVADLNRTYQMYSRYFSRHPLYESERVKWMKANSRNKNSRFQGKMWDRYWRRRLTELYEKDLAKCKYRLKTMLRLRTDIRTPSPPNRQNVSSGSFNEWSSSGNYVDDVYMDRRNYNEPPQRQYDQVGGGYFNQQEPREIYNSAVETPSQQLSEPLGVLSVLRLLTALEEQLGSLGAQAVQLMSRAVLAEKNNENPNDLMSKPEFYIFFVTAKEKIKGQLFANIIESNKIIAVQRALQDLTTLLEMFEDYMRRHGKSLPRADDASSMQTIRTKYSNISPNMDSEQISSKNTMDNRNENNFFASDDFQFSSNPNTFFTSSSNIRSMSNQYQSNELNNKFSGRGGGESNSGGGASGSGNNNYNNNAGYSGGIGSSSGGGGGGMGNKNYFNNSSSSNNGNNGMSSYMDKGNSNDNNSSWKNASYSNQSGRNFPTNAIWRR